MTLQSPSIDRADPAPFQAERDLLDDELSLLGLSDKERRFYLAAFEAGAASVTDLASRAGVTRTNGYDLLSRLQSRGLLRTVPSSSGRLVVPEDPSVLSQDWERRRTTLDSAIPKLRALLEASGVQWSVRTYTGRADIERALGAWNERSRGESVAALIGAMEPDQDPIASLALRCVVRLKQRHPGTALLVSPNARGSALDELEGVEVAPASVAAQTMPASMVLVEGHLVYIVSTGSESYLLSIRSRGFSTLMRSLLQGFGTH